MAWRLQKEVDMQGKAAFGKKPQGNASETVWALSHLWVAKAAVQPIAGGIEDAVDRVLGLIARQPFRGKSQDQAAKGCMTCRRILVGQ